MALDRATILQSAQQFAARGQFDSAIAEWRKLTTELPNDGSIFNTIGDLHLKRNASSEAIGAYLQAAAVYRAEGSTLKAIAAYKKVLKVDPSRYEVYRHLGDLNAERGLLSSAVSDYLTLGKFYLKERKTREALEIYKKIANQDPTNLDAQERVAELCVQENLQDEAIKVYLQLGRERSAQQRREEAKDAYLAVLRIEPGNSEAAQYVQMFEKGGESPRPTKQSASPSVGAQKSADAVDLLTEATRRMEEGQYAGAEAILTQVLTREPGNPQVCQLLARLHLHRGDLHVALNEYRFLAGAAMRAQDYPMAESLINEYLQVEPACVALLELLGSVYEEKGDNATAATQYGKAVEVLLEHPEPGMPTLPAELYEKVKTLAPSSPIIAKLASHFDSSTGATGGASVSVSSETPRQDMVKPPPSEAFTLEGASPDDAWRTTSKIHREQNRHLEAAGSGEEPAAAFFTKGAAPDGEWKKSVISSTTESVHVSGPESKTDQAIIERARQCVKGGQHEDAEKALSQVLAQDPDHAEARDLYGRLYEQKGDGVAAALQYTKALEILLAHPEQGKAEQPAWLYEKIKVLAPASPALARLAAQFEPASASQSTNSASAADEQRTDQEYETHYTLGVAYKNMGLLAEAMEEFQLSMHGTDSFMDSCLMLALCLKEQGQYQPAIARLSELLAHPQCQGDKVASVRYELALLYEREGRLDQAAPLYAAIPTFKDVPQRLASIGS